MNILCACDVLYLPEPKLRPMTLQTGQTNTFVTAPTPLVNISTTIQLGSEPLANASYRIQELADLGSITTDANGVAAFLAPVTLQFATLEFDTLGFTVVLKIGHLDPVDTPTGLCQRLGNLGYPVGAPGDESAMRTALTMFQLGQDGTPPDGNASDATIDALGKAHGS
jgi:hypothetical protein